jgi:hypothetical protein
LRPGRHHLHGPTLGPELVDLGIGGVAQREAGDEVVVARHLELGVEWAAPRSEDPDGAGVDSAGLGRQEQCLEHEARIQCRVGQKLLVDEDEAHHRRAEGPAIVAVHLIATGPVPTGHAGMLVEGLADGERMPTQILGVRRPDLVIAVGKVSRQRQFRHSPAFLVLDAQGLVELAHVGRTQSVGPLPGRQCQHEGARVGPARRRPGVVQDRIEDVVGNRIGAEIANGMPGGGQV